MTRAAAPDAAYEHRSFGAPGAERTVFLLRGGASALSDPLPDATVRRDVRVVAIGLTVDDIDDPVAYRGTTPAEATAQRIAQFVTEERGDRSVGIVGVATAGEVAIRVAALVGAGVDRLALVAVPRPESELGGHELAELLRGIDAKTLLMNGQGDPDARAGAARWFAERLPAARVEMVPTSAGPEARLGLSGVWERVLSHVAPGTIR